VEACAAQQREAEQRLEELKQAQEEEAEERMDAGVRRVLAQNRRMAAELQLHLQVRGGDCGVCGRRATAGLTLSAGPSLSAAAAVVTGCAPLLCRTLSVPAPTLQQCRSTQARAPRH
jgi:bacterioferritin-associated ferredoxin